jgi:phage-related protein
MIASFFAAFKIAEFIVAVAPFISTLASMISSGTLLSTVLSGIGTAFSAILSPVTLIAAALGLLIYTFIDLYNNSESFRQSIAELGQTWLTALQPLADFVGTVLSDAWNKILKPVIDFFVNTLLPNLIDTFKNLWENVLVPLGDFIGTVLQPVFQVLSDLLSMLWEKVILPLADAVGGVLKKAWDGLYQILNKTVIPIINKVIEVLKFLWEKVINPVISVLWDTLKPAFDTVFSGIGDVINGLGTTLGGIIDFITGVFTGDWSKAWEGIKSIFKGIWDALVGVVKTPINLIIDLINGLVGGIVKGLNLVIGAINKIKIDVPDWVPGIGGKTIGFNISTLTAPKIPKLATGTVVPANYGEFLAVLGDNKREAEVVSPVSTMKQAFKEAIAEMGGIGGGSGTLYATIMLRDKVVFEGMVEMDRQYRDQTGKSAFVY